MEAAFGEWTFDIVARRSARCQRSNANRPGPVIINVRAPTRYSAGNSIGSPLEPSLNSATDISMTRANAAHLVSQPIAMSTAPTDSDSADITANAPGTGKPSPATRSTNGHGVPNTRYSEARKNRASRARSASGRQRQSEAETARSRLPGASRLIFCRSSRRFRYERRPFANR